MKKKRYLKKQEKNKEINPTRVKSMGLGFNEENILLVIESLNDKNKIINFNTLIDVKDLHKIITLLYDCGLEYQKIYGQDIGFSPGEEE